MKLFKNNYFRNKFFAFFAILLLPFMTITQRFTVENGGSGLSAFEQEQAEKLKNELLNKFDDKIKDAIKDTITLDELQQERIKIIEEAKAALPAGKLSDIEKILTVQGEMINSIKADLEEAQPKEGIRSIIIKNHDAIKDAVDKRRSFSLSLKTDVLRTSVTDHTLAMRLQDISDLAYEGFNVEQAFNSGRVGPNSNGVIRYVDQNTVTRNAAMKGEADTYPESVITWIEKTLDIKKVADSIPVSYEAWNDIDFIESQIKQLLTVNLARVVEDQLLAGDGTGVNLKGVFTSATAFNSGAYSGFKPTSATLYDLLAIMKVEVANGKESKYMPNAVFLNPADILRMKLAKDAENNYILPPFIAANGMQVDGMKVYENPFVTANTLVLGDFRFGTVYTLDDIMLELGYVNDDFIKDLTTIKAKRRLALLIRSADEDAFLKSTNITTDITNITA